MTQRTLDGKDTDRLWRRGILTPPETLQKLDAEFHFTFDPCPYPRPVGFDGLSIPWGTSNYVNPLFWGGGLTAWVRKALQERDRGNTIVLALPVDGWVATLIREASEIRVMQDWYWLTPEGEKRQPSRPLLLWVLKP